jgi:beta-galactosidase
MPELKRDLENLKRHGFNLVKLQEHWAVDEPAEGEYDFSRCEELIAHAASLDLGVYLGLTCEQAPAWLWRKHPDCRMVGRSGLPVAYEAQSTLPYDGKPGPCFDHPGARADQLRFLQRLVRTLGSYENIVVWNTWQEIGYGAELIVGQPVCFCENTLGFFRDWLREQYRDLDCLNRAWNSRYREWRDVSPNRDAWGKGCFPQDIAWRYFMDNVQIARVLRERAQAIREADPLARPIFAHKGVPTIGSGQDWTYARTQDFLGSSCYPAGGYIQAWDDAHPGPGEALDRHAALLTEMWDALALKFDYLRCCNRPGRPVWAAEFQGGPVSAGFHKGRVPSADDIRRWMLTAVGSGVTGICFWVTRAEIMAAEANGYSLLDSEGDSTPRFEEASRVGRALNAQADLFARPCSPPAQAAILVNEWNYQFCASMAEGGDHLAYSLRGWYRLLWEAGIPVDFLEASDLGASQGPRPRVLILPFPLSLSEQLAEKLARYVAEGGNLISEAAPGRMNEHGYCTRGELSAAARELFGVRHDSFTMVREPEGARRWSPPEHSWGDYLEPALLAGTGPLAGHRLRANVYLETFLPAGGEPCLTFGEAVAGTVRRCNKGAAWLLGTYAGHNGAAYPEAESRDCLLALLRECGVAPEGQGQLLVRKRVSDKKEAWLFTNPLDHDVTERVDISGWSRVEDLFGEPLERDGARIRLSVKSLDVRVLLLERPSPA